MKPKAVVGYVASSQAAHRPGTVRPESGHRPCNGPPMRLVMTSLRARFWRRLWTPDSVTHEAGVVCSLAAAAVVTAGQQQQQQEQQQES
ncbi:hypothetical protein AWZ03_009328 [Drosophila navojoa]|uniref:Uncharacterized protein n=1 Tax=Drosophila navojoa TaxID=7232 RepID=A0A484B651_DRONA|nr:hypothetical protein AWZ03_009328 [Drosophila navojoa]